MGLAGNHLDADLSTRTQAGTEVYRLLLRLKTFIDQRQISLGDLPYPEQENRQTMSKTWRIVFRVPILTLKGAEQCPSEDCGPASCSGVHPSTETGPGVAHMASSGKASLYRLDNPAEIQAEDRDAVLIPFR